MDSELHFSIFTSGVLAETLHTFLRLTIATPLKGENVSRPLRTFTAETKRRSHSAHHTYCVLFTCAAKTHPRVKRQHETPQIEQREFFSFLFSFFCVGRIEQSMQSNEPHQHKTSVQRGKREINKKQHVCKISIDKLLDVMLMEAPRGYPLHQGGQGRGGKKARGGEKKWRFECLWRIRQREAQLLLLPTRARPTSVSVGTVASTRQSHSDHKHSYADTTVAVLPLQFFA